MPKTAFKIEKGIAIPPAGRKIGSTKYPWPDMSVKDSVFIKGRTLAAITSSFTKWAKSTKSKYQFVARKVDNGVRVWRVK